MRIGTVAASPVTGGKVLRLRRGRCPQDPRRARRSALEDVGAATGDPIRAAKIGWDDGPNVTASTETIIKAVDAASKTTGVISKQEGMPAAAGSKKLEVIYQLPFLDEAPRKPMITTLHVRPNGAKGSVGTQVSARAQATMATETGLPPNSVMAHNPCMGRAFGRRLLWLEQRRT